MPPDRLMLLVSLQQWANARVQPAAHEPRYVSRNRQLLLGRALAPLEWRVSAAALVRLSQALSIVYVGRR